MTDGKKALSVDLFLSKWALGWHGVMDEAKEKEKMKADLGEMLKAVLDDSYWRGWESEFPLGQGSSKACKDITEKEG